MAVGNETAERSCTVHTQRHERGQPVISANPSSCFDFSWLRGLDLNQRPLGYETSDPGVTSQNLPKVHNLDSVPTRRLLGLIVGSSRREVGEPPGGGTDPDSPSRTRAYSLRKPRRKIEGSPPPESS
jgi:hypothetical protein